MNNPSMFSFIFCAFDEKNIKRVCLDHLMEVFDDAIVTSSSKALSSHIGRIEPFCSRAVVRTKKSLSIIVDMKESTHVCFDQFQFQSDILTAGSVEKKSTQSNDILNEAFLVRAMSAIW